MAKLDQDLPSKEEREREERRQMLRHKLVVRTEMTVIGGGLLAWIASGYFPRRRLLLLAMGAIGIGSIVAKNWWESRDVEQYPKTEADVPPAERIANTVLTTALHEKASEVLLRVGMDVRVQLLIDGVWHDRIRIPAHTWKDMRQFWSDESENGTKPVRVFSQDLSGQFMPYYERDDPFETLTFKRVPDNCFA